MYKAVPEAAGNPDPQATPQQSHPTAEANYLSAHDPTTIPVTQKQSAPPVQPR